MGRGASGSGSNVIGLSDILLSFNNAILNLTTLVIISVLNFFIYFLLFWTLVAYALGQCFSNGAPENLGFGKFFEIWPYE